VGRRKLGISHPKLKEVLHKDFADCFALADILSSQDAAVCCLGTCTGSLSDAELRAITADYTIEFARVLRGSSPNATFSFFFMHLIIEALQSRVQVSLLVQVDHTNAGDLRRSYLSAIIQPFEQQTQPAPNVALFESVRTAL
jgi:hypothetical protein